MTPDELQMHDVEPVARLVVTIDIQGFHATDAEVTKTIDALNEILRDWEYDDQVHDWRIDRLDEW